MEVCMINTVIIGLIIFEILVLIFMGIKLLTQKEIVDIKNAKYFIPTLIVNFCVYAIAIFGYGEVAKNDFILNLSDCISQAIGACVLKVDLGVLSPAISQNVLFEVAFNISFFLNLFALLFALLGIIGRYFSNFFKTKRILFGKKEIFVILGYNEDAKKFAQTIPSKNVIFWIGDVAKDFKKELLSKKFLNLKFDKINAKGFSQFKNKRVTFISFDTNSENILKIINSYKEIDNHLFNLYISIDNQYEEAFKFNYGNENISFFNKYSLISQKFITDYPMTRFLSHSQIDYSTASVSSDTSLSVLLIGHGNPNKNLFNYLIADNQFPTLINGTPTPKIVDYHIFDKNDFADKNYNSNFGRFCDGKFNQTEYFDLPTKPMNLTYHKKDFYKKEFQVDLDEFVNSLKDKNDSLTYVIVSFGSDLDNIDEVIRLKQYFKQYNMLNIKYFCRITNAIYKNVLLDAGVEPYGEYDIMNYDTIICEKLNKLSIERNFQEELKNAEVVEQLESINKISRINQQQRALDKLKLNLWNSQDVNLKDFDIFSSINIRTKLNLCGFDLIGTEEVSNKEFYKVYDPLKEIIYNKREKVYTYPYPDTLSTRNMLAYQEQLRSNAFWFIKGFIPMKKKNYITANHLSTLNTTTRELLTLTTFKGLDDITKDINAESKKHNIQVNVDDINFKRNLYQIMDNIPLYKYSIYRIYKKED